MKRCLIFILFFVTLNSFAGWIRLVCKEPTDASKDGFTMVVEFDEVAQRIRVFRDQVIPAFIDKVEIGFVVTLGGTEYLHHIDRQTGVLIITNLESKVKMMPHRCERPDPNKRLF